MMIFLIFFLVPFLHNIISTDIAFQEEVRLFDWELLQEQVSEYLNETQCHKSSALCFQDTSNE